MKGNPKLPLQPPERTFSQVSQLDPVHLYYETQQREAWQKHASFTANAAEFKPDFSSIRSQLGRMPNPDAVDFVPGSFLSNGIPQKKSDIDEECLKKGADFGEGLPCARELESIFSPTTATLPEYSLPASYYIGRPILKSSHIQRFSYETLFYIFYNVTGDNLQALAAADL